MKNKLLFLVFISLIGNSFNSDVKEQIINEPTIENETFTVSGYIYKNIGNFYIYSYDEQKSYALTSLKCLDGKEAVFHDLGNGWHSTELKLFTLKKRDSTDILNLPFVDIVKYELPWFESCTIL